ncbi:MAG: hypothetical protein H5T64_12780 [Chloroflexi bacterium]|nr:hypothetical protein [Chloroflexota bacterium]
MKPNHNCQEHKALRAGLLLFAICPMLITSCGGARPVTLTPAIVVKEATVPPQPVVQPVPFHFGSRETLRLEASLDQDTYSPGWPIELTIQLTNESSESLDIFLPLSSAVFIEVFGPDGYPLPLRDTYDLSANLSGTESVAPGATVQEMCDLFDRYEFGDLRGEFRVRVSYSIFRYITVEKEGRLVPGAEVIDTLTIEKGFQII